MQDKQNKGIGAYKDRPGYFMGGMIGGAILGALVNKIQGKDWKRGALWGGITGGLGSAFLGKGSSSWISKMAPGMTKSLATMGAGNPALAGGIIGGGAAWMAGDPEKEREDAERYRREQYIARYNRNKSMYDKWYTNPFTGEEMNPHLGWNRGGAISERPGYPGGGSATLEYTNPDLYTPTGEGGGPGSNPIQQIPLGPEPSFTDEFEDFDYMKAGSGGDESGWYEMFFNEFGRPPVDIKELQLFIDQSDISPTDVAARGGGQGPMMAAEGGYKKKPQYAGGGIEDLDMTGGGASYGPGTGTSDDIPAMLSDGEFVVTANAVKNLGEGDRMLGAQRMYRMMNQLDPNSQTPAEMSGVGYA
jgi:hypothetical protein